MTAQASLFVEKVKPALVFCSCGHHAEHHADLRRECEYGRETKFGGCTCKKFTPKGRPPIPQAPSLAPPLGARIIMRPDTVREKPMGWAWMNARTPAKLTIYLDHLRTHGPNVLARLHFVKLPEKKKQGMRIGILKENESCVIRAQTAVEENLPSIEGRPLKSIHLTRIISGPGLDDDNLEGALKYVRDGVADALRVDDRTFRGLISYGQRSPGKRGVFGAMIELVWGGS